MTKEALTDVIQRSLSDATFRRRIATDPTALGGYDLTADEAKALRSGDPASLSAFGVDRRMSKMFALDGGAASHSGAVEPRDVEPAVLGGTNDATAGGSAEPRDVEPYWAGDATTVADASAVEPRDIAPVDIGGADPFAADALAVEPHDIEPTDLSGDAQGGDSLHY